MNNNFALYEILFGEVYSNLSEYFTTITDSSEANQVYFDLAFSGMALPAS